MIKRQISKLIISFVVLVGLLTTPLGFALAEDDASTRSSDTGTSTKQSIRDELKTERENAAQALQAYKDAKQERQLVELKLYGNKAITVRTNAISRQQKRLSSGICKDIDATAKAALIAALNDVSANLSTQKTKITNETDLATEKTNVKSIFSENRVFADLIPAINGACLSQHLLTLMNGRLTTTINKLKTAGLDTTALEAKLDSAKTTATAAYSLYLSIAQNPGTDGNKAKFTEAKTDLQTVRKALGDIKSDIGNLMGEYKKETSDNNTTNSTTPAE